MNTPRCLVFGSLLFSVLSLSASEAPAPGALPAPPPPASASSVSKPPADKPIVLSDPRGIAVAPDGTIYIGDIGNAAVYKMTPDGKISLLAGGPNSSSIADGLGANAGFASPTGLALDKDGNVYVADGDSNTIRKITPAGLVTTLAGKAGDSGNADGKGAAARFNGETALAVDKDGNVIVADTHNGSIRKITPDGTVTTLTAKPAGGLPASGKPAPLDLSSPRAITIDKAGVIYVADEVLGVVAKVAPDGTLTLIAGNPNATDVDKDGVGPAAVILTPRGLTVDAKGNLYVADTDDGLIRKITPDGTVTTFAGKSNDSDAADGKGSAAHFAGPRGLAVDKDGNVYVADSDNGLIRKITSEGVVTTLGKNAPEPASAAKP